MNRLAAMLLCALLAAAVMAAPAPAPRASGPWFDGWDRPVDPRGDCRFERKGDKLTITVPGEGHELDVKKGRLNAPYLLRNIEGDFAAQVRVGADFRHAELVGRGVERGAGLLLVDEKTILSPQGKTFISLQRVAGADDLPLPGGEVARFPLCSSEPGLGVRYYTHGPPLGKPAFLRLVRRGEELTMAYSQDGEKWTPTRALRFSGGLKLPRKLKVGVYAESTAPGPFKAVFDQFRLTPLGPDGKPLGGRAR
jgi:hypothetical protein